MPIVYILAGPPGIGKSINGGRFISSEVDIINQDDILLKYKAEGYTDFTQISAFKTDEIIKLKLIKKVDFALELNLGFPNQWKYAKNILRFNAENNLHVLLFFTNSLDLCLNRAKNVMKTVYTLSSLKSSMYDQTIPLFKKNFDLIDHALFIDVDEINGLEIVAEYTRYKSIKTFGDVPAWFLEQLHSFLTDRML